METIFYNMIVFDLQRFADDDPVADTPDPVTYTAAGSLVNASVNYVNAYTGETEAFNPPSQTLTPAMQDIYVSSMLENARMKMIFGQFAKKHSLPAKHGRYLTFKKWNTLPRADELQEGVIPKGKKLGMTSKSVTVKQYGMYVAVTDILSLHAVDDVIRGATEELGASAAETSETLTVGGLLTSSNIMYCDNVTVATGAVTGATPTSPAQMEGDATTCSMLTYRQITKAVNILSKAKAPRFNDQSGGYYIGVIHSDIETELLNDPQFIDISKYQQSRKLFIGEIGTLGGVRFISSPDAPVQGGDYKNKDNGVTYACMFFGKDAFDTVDVEGGNMRIIVKPQGTIGGPLEQFSTIGYKFETNGADMLYPERLLLVRCCSPMYSSVTEANY